MGFLYKSNDSEWVSPYLSQLKPKTNCVQFLSDFRNLNRQINCKPYKMPKISELLLKLEVFKYDMSLDLNMGCYNIRISKDASNLYIIILPWGNITINAYLWGSEIHRKHFKRKIITYSKSSNLYVCKWTTY